MKILKWSVLYIIMLFLFCGILRADTAETVQPTAFLVNYADSNAAALDFNETSWSVAEEWTEISSQAKYLKVKFYVKDTSDPNERTFSYQFYVADKGCNAEIVASGDANCGAAQMSHDPVTMSELNSGDVDPNYCWVDTLGTITTDWEDGDVDAINDDGANSVASFEFNRLSAKTAYCRIYNMSSSATMTVYCVAYYY
jgi:hypothetical protein